MDVLVGRERKADAMGAGRPGELQRGPGSEG